MNLKDVRQELFVIEDAVRDAMFVADLALTVQRVLAEDGKEVAPDYFPNSLRTILFCLGVVYNGITFSSASASAVVDELREWQAEGNVLPYPTVTILMLEALGFTVDLVTGEVSRTDEVQAAPTAAGKAVVSVA